MPAAMRATSRRRCEGSVGAGLMPSRCAPAARAGGQQIDVNAAAEGEPLTVDSGAAVAAASDYLAAAGVAGSASIVDGGTALAVTTTATYEPRFLGSIGLGPLTVEGHASTRLVRVQQGSEN